MPHPSKTKGDKAELELAKLLTELIGGQVRRKLGAGRADDTGDLDGLADTTAEVKNYADLAAAVNAGLNDSVREQANAGTTFGVAFIRRRGGRWFAAMTLDQWATWYREATKEQQP